MSANKPNISQIRKYLNGELDARAMHELERQALDDPFLADALEGYERKGNQQQQLEELQKRLQHRIAPEHKRLTLWTSLTIAASVLLFVAAGGWWLVNSRSSVVKKELAAPDKTIVKTQPVMPAVKTPLPKPDSAVLKPATPGELMVANNRKGAQQKSLGNRYVPPKADMAPAPQAESAPAQPQEVQANEAIAYSPKLAQRLVRDKAAIVSGLPGNSADVRIRGVGSATGKEPLYVLDGRVYQGKLNEINPKDIEKITTLKDAASTSVYGSKAANGVILITTKKGSLARLKSDSLMTKNMLAEVVVTGYPTQYKRDVTGSVSTVQGVQTQSLEQSLQGTLAGVVVSRGKKPKASDTLRTITGQVLDKNNGNPLPGVSVTVANQSRGAQTDANGKFKIKASNPDELVLGYIGYESKRVKVKGKDSLNVSLSPSSSALSEVVVVGYGTTKQEMAARPANGWSGFNQYIKEQAKPVNGITGVVRISFTVEADGTLSNFKVLKSLNTEADKKAIALITNGPQWRANTNGKPETVKLRIRFKN